MKKDSGTNPSRRRLLTTGLLAGTSAAAFAVGRQLGVTEPTVAVDGQNPSQVDLTSPFGNHQFGVTAPDPRQQHVIVSVFALADVSNAPALLDALGRLVAESFSGKHLAGLKPANLTLTVGIGPRTVRKFFAQGIPGDEELPDFTSDDFESDQHSGGDLMVQICSDDPTVSSLTQNAVNELLAKAATVNWQAQGFRGAVDQGIGRNLLGFHDGVSVPRTEDDQNDLVWINKPARIAGSTIMVVRRMPIDVSKFSKYPIEKQEQIIGRQRHSGIPLSGGSLTDDPNLHAKSQAGEFDIPLGAHVRRAHPLPSGAKGLMLRRSYSYFNSSDDQGLLFISFQNELRTFTATQHRMDEQDDLMKLTRTTASGTFLIVPGFNEHRPLGAFLRS